MNGTCETGRGRQAPEYRSRKLPSYPTKGWSQQRQRRPAQHVYINHDRDLLEVTLQTSEPNSTSRAGTTGTGQHAGTHGEHGSVHEQAGGTGAGGKGHPTRRAALTAAGSHQETVHTTASHLWLTTDRGWVPAGQLHIGEQVRRADGGAAAVVAVHTVRGTAPMWDLTVSHVHTFAVGAGAYVVHNDDCSGGGGSQASGSTGSG